MKTRTGFVSNSSSSSFIAVATLPAFREALSRMEDERDVKILKVVAEQSTCMGLPVQIVKEFTDAGGFSSIWGCDSEDQSEILKKAGVEQTCPVCDGETEDEDAECTCEDYYPTDAVFSYTSVLKEMSKEKDWKDQVFQCDVGDGG